MPSYNKNVNLVPSFKRCSESHQNTFSSTKLEWQRHQTPQGCPDMSCIVAEQIACPIEIGVPVQNASILNA